jgi:hypothetical protein
MSVSYITVKFNIFFYSLSLLKRCLYPYITIKFHIFLYTPGYEKCVTQVIPYLKSILFLSGFLARCYGLEMFEKPKHNHNPCVSAIPEHVFLL